MTASERHRTEIAQDTVLKVNNATVTFDMDRGESRVLDDVSLDIQRNEILGVVGESGSGKSMFASALMDAVVDPGQLTGEVTYYPPDGDPVDILNLSDSDLRQLRWEEISMVFQGAMSSFNPTTKIRAHFTETLKAHGEDVDEGMQRAREILSDLYLDPDRVLDVYPHELSGGMSQRALIALSLVLEPEVMVMDEPTAALDLLMQRSILKMLREIRDKYDLTLVFITHDLPLVAELANRLAVLYAFEFVEVGECADVLRNAAHPYTRSLLNATPNLRTPVSEMEPIGGSAPDPVNVPEGCSYHTRCLLANERCRQEAPDFYDVEDGEGHRAACHYWEEARETIEQNAGETAAHDAETTAPGSASSVGEITDKVIVSLDDVKVHFEEETGMFGFFSEPETVRAVDGVDLEIPENDVVALVGESGCGKTTLGRTAIGRERPTDGSVRYRGQDIWDAKEGKGDVDVPFTKIRESLQIIHQDPGSSLNPYRKVKKSLAEPLKRWHDDLTADDRTARILHMLETVGMAPPEDYANRYPHQLSGGEQQRIALIRALLMNPDLILADESVSALDVSLRVEMMDLMLELQDQFNTSYLFISHDLSNARYITEKADGRIGIMYLGQLVEIGTPSQILHNPQHPYTKALVWSSPDLQVDREDDANLPLRTIDIPDPIDPPSGCRFHTRCPEAREVCKSEEPSPCSVEGEKGQVASCFRMLDDHEYWQSEPLMDDDGINDPSIAD